jgi:DNA-binding transcriptional LysR family regulator
MRKYFMPRLLGLFCARYPGVDAELKVSTRAEVIARLEHNADDLCIMGHPPQGLNVVTEAFMDNELVVIARGDHALAGRRRVALARLVEEPFLMREAGSGTRLALEELLVERGLHARVRMEFASNEAIKQAVLGGLGVAVVSRHALAADAHDSGIVALDVAHFPLRRHWYVVHPAEKRHSVVAHEFLRFLRERGVTAHAPAVTEAPAT